MVSAPERDPERIVDVLRLGHRPGRDPRLTTHVALTARAWGVRRLYLEPPDPSLAERVRALTRRFGGSFAVEGVTSPRSFLASYPGTVLHLTIYGEDLDEVVPTLEGPGPFLLVVGGAKVPPEIYRLAHRNLAVTHEPHSEVAALAIALDRLRGTPRDTSQPGAKLRVRPSARRKRVEEVEPEGPSAPRASSR
jgi:tRNA (cytidine56-2'-O)-methyltransferase